MSHRTTSGSDWIWRPTRCAIYLRDGMRCLTCGAEPGTHRARSLSLDHIRGRSNRATNLLTICVSCNAERGTRSLEEFAGAELALRLRAQARKPLDRAAGRALARELWPHWMLRQAQRGRVQRARRWFEAA